jgi:hypothetical protein
VSNERRLHQSVGLHIRPEHSLTQLTTQRNAHKGTVKGNSPGKSEGGQTVKTLKEEDYFLHIVEDLIYITKCDCSLKRKDPCYLDCRYGYRCNQWDLNNITPIENDIIRKALDDPNIALLNLNHGMKFNDDQKLFRIIIKLIFLGRYQIHG